MAFQPPVVDALSVRVVVDSRYERVELIRGELSGPARPFNSAAFKRRMASKHAGEKAR